MCVHQLTEAVFKEKRGIRDDSNMGRQIEKIRKEEGRGGSGLYVFM
jgi:hypothetical protein